MPGSFSKPRGTWIDAEDGERSLLTISCPSPKTAWTLEAKVSEARPCPLDRVKQQWLLSLGRFFFSWSLPMKVRTIPFSLLVLLRGKESVLLDPNHLKEKEKKHQVVSWDTSMVRTLWEILPDVWNVFPHTHWKLVTLFFVYSSLLSWESRAAKMTAIFPIYNENSDRKIVTKKYNTEIDNRENTKVFV